MNDWVHEHTPWKTFIHSCGSVVALLPDIVDAGFDILNPVQCSAAGMDPRTLKERFGGRVTFWGGGVDTQKTLPFGTPDEVRREVRERIEIFKPRRRLRVQHGPQRAGAHAGGEPAGDVRRRPRGTIGVGWHALRKRRARCMLAFHALPSLRAVPPMS